MIERQIIIGLITSTEFLQKIKPIWNPQLLESSTAKRVATWIWEYYDTYNKAPGKDIETIFFTKLKTSKLPKDIAEEIEQDILPSLSTEYEQSSFNLEALVDATEKHFSSQSLLLLSATIQAAVESGETDKAITAISSYQPLSGATKDLNEHIRSVAQIRRLHLKPPKLLLKPWLREGQLTIIYGNYGTGKSLLAISIAYLLGLDKFDTEDCEIGEWQVKNRTGCLYLDGELGALEMEERIAQFEWLGPQQREYRTKVLSLPEYQLFTEDSFSLSSRGNQLKVKQWLKDNPKYKLVILDSASTLFALEDENSNSEWNTKVNPFLRDLRALGVSCILLHHSGKDGKRGLRGASAMGAMAQNIYRLVNHGDKQTDEGEAWFTITKDKQRGAGRSFKTFSLHYIQSDDKKSTTWHKTN